MYAKKLIAPIVIIAIMLLYFMGFLFGFVMIPDLPFLFKVLLIIVPLGLIGVSIFVLVERIQEIRSGEEDDLSKY